MPHSTKDTYISDETLEIFKDYTDPTATDNPIDLQLKESRSIVIPRSNFANVINDAELELESSKSISERPPKSSCYDVSNENFACVFEEAHLEEDNIDIKDLTTQYEIKKQDLESYSRRFKTIFDRLSSYEQERIFLLIEELVKLPEPQFIVAKNTIDKLAKQAKLPILPEKLTEEQIYKPVEGLRGEDLRKHLMDHLERVWGRYLTYFNKELEEDVLYQDYLWEHDHVFMRKLYDKLKKDYNRGKSMIKPEEIIMRQTDRVSKAVEDLPETERKKYRQIASAIDRRR